MLLLPDTAFAISNCRINARCLDRKKKKVTLLHSFKSNKFRGGCMVTAVNTLFKTQTMPTAIFAACNTKPARKSNPAATAPAAVTHSHALKKLKRIGR